MAKPFAADPRLSSPYPKPEELVAALSGASRGTREIIARLWLTEGLPAAFQASPAAYEDLRGWLAAQLCVHPKEVTLIGSARIGYSLAPSPSFGRPFSPRSDLDLSVISDDLFRRLATAFSRFSADYETGAIKPRSERERFLWEQNLEFGTRNIPRGFLDSNKIPNFTKYQVAQQINQSMWALVKKLEVTPHAPQVRTASARVYRDWRSFVDRVEFNLRAGFGTAQHAASGSRVPAPAPSEAA